MLPLDKVLLAFVDPKDPFMPTGIAGQLRPGPVLSVLGSRQFSLAHLFYTPHTRANADQTVAEIRDRFPSTEVKTTEIPVSDPKDYSRVMGRLALEVRKILPSIPRAEKFVCVSSGTAEMRAAWFLLAAAGYLPAKLLQVGSPAEPLYGAANVTEVELGSSDWRSLRDLVMPQEYFIAAETRPMPAAAPSAARSILSGALDRLRPRRAEAEPAEEVLHELAEPTFAMRVETPYPGLEEALAELGIFIGSAALRAAAERVAVAAPTDLPVLLRGETGTGKELFARLVHRLSPRRHRPLITVNCAAIPKELVESQLFGHLKGSFTGAVADQQGKFELAHGGTLFLDEIGELPPEAQAKLLRAIQECEIEPLGATKPRKVDVRLVAATNLDLRAEAAAGRFRQDLYFRLEVIEVVLPPLRARGEEISRLALAFLDRINGRLPKPKQLGKSALRRLQQHPWPGNVRELANVLERSLLFSPNEVLEGEDVLINVPPPGPDPLSSLPDPVPGFSLEHFLAQARNQLFLRALEKTSGNQSAAAELLGVSKQAVSKFLKEQNDNAG